MYVENNPVMVTQINKLILVTAAFLCPYEIHRRRIGVPAGRFTFAHLLTLILTQMRG